jgi:mannose/fructose/N-acetylgalactosamine-specific phosphotransferase system component IIC
MQGVAGTQSGVASGLLNTSRLMGGALGLAILSTIASGHTHAAASAAGAGTAGALTSGFDLAFTVAIGFALIGALVAAFSLRPASESAALVDLPEPVEGHERQAVAA